MNEIKEKRKDWKYLHKIMKTKKKIKQVETKEIENHERKY